MAYRRGHVTGHKREKARSQAWYTVHAQYWIAQVERQEAAKVQAQPQPTQAA